MKMFTALAYEVRSHNFNTSMRYTGRDFSSLACVSIKQTFRHAEASIPHSDMNRNDHIVVKWINNLGAYGLGILVAYNNYILPFVTVPKAVNSGWK